MLNFCSRSDTANLLKPFWHQEVDGREGKDGEAAERESHGQHRADDQHADRHAVIAGIARGAHLADWFPLPPHDNAGDAGENHRQAEQRV